MSVLRGSDHPCLSLKGSARSSWTASQSPRVTWGQMTFKVPASCRDPMHHLLSQGAWCSSFHKPLLSLLPPGNRYHGDTYLTGLL